MRAEAREMLLATRKGMPFSMPDVCGVSGGSPAAEDERLRSSIALTTTHTQSILSTLSACTGTRSMHAGRLATCAGAAPPAGWR